jgi:chaperonin cofactor prefoldin
MTDTTHDDLAKELRDRFEKLDRRLAKMQRSRDRYREAWEAEKARTTLAAITETPHD